MQRIGTPICDFVTRYAKSHTLRLHMPGHKGVSLLGFEGADITEIRGADSLFEAEGIIAESEKNASSLFGAHTVYSTEGSSLCIRAMLWLMAQNAPKRGEKTVILAGRNAHRSFVSAAALLDLEVEWLYPPEGDSYLSCGITPADLEGRLTAMRQKPTAVYITSPDYLGNMADVQGLARVCHAHGVYFLVDNAHGAYLKFLRESRHPIDMGADLCCDSAHKTLPVLTGGAYLHIAKHLPPVFAREAKQAMALFGSTSPSYLILQSLDAANGYLSTRPTLFSDFAAQVDAATARLRACGIVLVGDEPLKWTISAKPLGYTGTELADCLRGLGIECEFADPDFLVLMLSPCLSAEELNRLAEALTSIPRRAPRTDLPPVAAHPLRVMPLREALFSPAEVLPAEQCLGRVLASVTVGCPPAVPVAVCGERLDADTLCAFAYYGMKTCTVVKE